MISLKAQYALRALLALAKTDPDELSLIAEIAEAQRIPKKFLEQILLDLKHHGIVASRRGKLGGYSLLRPADQITFGEVLRVIDGPLAPLPCLSRMAYRRCEGCVDERYLRDPGGDGARRRGDAKHPRLGHDCRCHGPARAGRARRLLTAPTASRRACR